MTGAYSLRLLGYVVVTACTVLRGSGYLRKQKYDGLTRARGRPASHSPLLDQEALVGRQPWTAWKGRRSRMTVLIVRARCIRTNEGEKKELIFPSRERQGYLPGDSTSSADDWRNHADDILKEVQVNSRRESACVQVQCANCKQALHSARTQRRERAIRVSQVQS